MTVGGTLVEDVDMAAGVPHSFMISADVDGNDIWVGTAKGLGWGIGDGYYPGTKLAISEYNFGALDHINGALAQADALGTFDREGLHLATLWWYSD